ncbi:uncharacterized protein LOC115735179 [Rhodamnia argentea]|uniref:Uncharacterized protein LOC115735179 n=1 Tax=Rhodamnia argentea TaxID=178133 RepID=A0A8B8NJ93_9MYRT|nr:uncharacterized protein LOC115735179 [Rhodamnia argentea]XP_030522160.1 uncharacterized protein LOC115735179 [Rhodamnia argentea]XP_048127824.1 uncharacterized protein LOC115735179 [Rhodamnia argentea]
MQMDILSRAGTTVSQSFWSRQRSSSSSSSSFSLFKPSCSRREPRQDGDDRDKKGDKFSTDWDKAWSNFKKQGKKNLFSGFSPDKYVSWNPRRSDYPLSEEVDPIKRTERSNLMLWTSPRFTLVVAILIVTFLLVYTILAPVK